MIKTARGKLLPLAAVGALALGVAGCGGSPNGEAEASGKYTDLEAELDASGASFPDAFYQKVIEGFGTEAPNVVINYDSTGSGTGKQQFADGLTDFAGTDSLVSEEDKIEKDSFHYVPTVAAPITMSYNLPGVDKLQLSADTIAGIFQGDIKKWNDEAVAEDNPDAKLPDLDITAVHRQDGSGTTSNFTSYLDEASKSWDLGVGETVEWPSDSQAGEKNTGVAQAVKDTEGGIGYVDLADAEETGLSYASVKNADGKYTDPTLKGTTAALEGAEVNDDLSYNPLNAEGAEAYPIAAPTYLLLKAKYDDSAKADAVKGFVQYMLNDAQDTAKKRDFAKLPDELREKALKQLDKVKS